MALTNLVQGKEFFESLQKSLKKVEKSLKKL